MIEKDIIYSFNFVQLKGGTSAGAAVLGEYLFSAEINTITSAEALANPYNSKLSLRDNLFKFSLLKNTITDTHYNNPDRRGRHIAFMARFNIINF
jgi:cyanophycinase